MRRITRQEAELLCESARVVDSSVEQKTGLLCVHLVLEDENRCVVLYDHKTRMKLYYHHPVTQAKGGCCV